MKDIIFTKEFEGLPVYDNKKSNYGFYLPMLQKIHDLFAVSLDQFDRPRVAHFVINKPINGIGSKVGRILDRWSAKQHASNGEKGSAKVYFFLCHEVRPRTKEHHAHLAIFFDGLSWKDLVFLEQKLCRLSLENDARIFKRSKERMPLSCDSDTGEIHLSSDGTPKRKTSSYYHDISAYLHDAFERISYLAKVFSKTKQLDQPIYSASHINCSSSKKDNPSNRETPGNNTDEKQIDSELIQP